ncbi:MAG: DUF2157 domain-containing protein [Rhodobacteraceae bacterium]|nr:DUF2157 domain-containing protein [Paracoccaceae bacterium]
MLDIFYKGRVRQDLETWVDKGWVTPEAATQILSSLETGDGRNRLPIALAGIGVVCIALALAAFIAANWDVVPRSVKLSGIVAGVVISNGVAAWAFSRGKTGLSDLVSGFATMVFVGGLALVGQIFHLPSDWAGGTLLVCIGALASAWIAGSKTSLLIAAIAAISWPLLQETSGGLLDILMGGVITAIVFAHVMQYPNRLNRSAAVALLFVTYGNWLRISIDFSGFDISTTAAALGFGALALISLQVGQIADLSVKWSGFYPQKTHGRWLLFRSLQNTGMVVLVALLVISFLMDDYVSSENFQNALLTATVALPLLISIALCVCGLVLSFKTRKAMMFFVVMALSLVTLLMQVAVEVDVVTAAFNLAALIAVSMLGTLYSNTTWTFSGYAGVAAMALWLLYVTIGSLLGQSAFFLIAGVLLLCLALFATRHLRRSKEDPQGIESAQEADQ